MLSSRSGCSSTTIGTSSRHARLLRQFNEDIFKRHVLTDVEVVVAGGKVFKSHRAVLICFSPALKRKLLSDDGKPIAKKVYISRISSEDFETLLHYMYTGDLNVSCNNFYDIFRAASVLEMLDIMQECLQILDRPDDIPTYFYIYVTAKKMEAQKNWLRALRLLAHRFEESICDLEFLKLDLNCVVELLSAQSIGARSEVLVFLAALNWLNHDYIRRRDHAVEVMECVRFSSMTMDEVVACYNPPILPQLLEIQEIVTMLFKATCYITAKFLGQESWFRHFGSPKRNLAFENLPMELWQKKEHPNNSSTDLVVNWQNSLKSELLDYNNISRNSKTDVNNFTGDYKTHGKNANSTTSSKSLRRIQNDLKNPERNRSLGERGESSSHLAEAVKKVLEQSARTSKDEINAAEVVKRVLGEINTKGDQREEAKPEEENRYRQPQDKVKNVADEAKTNTISYFEPSHNYQNPSKPRTSNKNRYNQVLQDRNSAHHPTEHSHKHSPISPAAMVAATNLQCLSKGSKPRQDPEGATSTQGESMKSELGIQGLSKRSKHRQDPESTTPAQGDSVKSERMPQCLSKGYKPRQDSESASATQGESVKSDRVHQSISNESKPRQNLESVIPAQGESLKSERVDQRFSKESKPSQNLESVTPAQGESLKYERVNQRLSKESKPRQDPESANPTQEESVKSDRNEDSNEVTGIENRKEPVIFTAVKEISRLFKDKPVKVTKLHLKYDSPQAQAQLVNLEEHPAKQQFVIQKSSSVNIYEKEKESSSIHVSLESPHHKSKKETPAILLIGGMNPNSLHTIGIGGAILNYDPKKNKWTRYSTLPSPRHNHSAVFGDNCLYIIGGCNPLETLQQKRYVAKRSCHKLDVTTLQWSVLQDMKFTRYDHGSVVLDGQIYAIGGQDNGERLLKTMEVYDIKTGKWEVLPSEMCCGRKAMGTALFDGKIWIAGGLMQAEKEITQQVVAHVDCYDPKQKRWAFHLCSLPTPRCYCSLAVWNDRIYCIGGLILDSREKIHPTSDVWIWNDEKQIWESGPSLPVPRMSCATLVHDDLLYVIGGFDPDSDVAIRNVNYLSPAAICWEVAAPLPSHLFGIAGVSVPYID